MIKEGTQVKILAIRNRFLDPGIIGKDAVVFAGRPNPKLQPGVNEYLLRLDGCEGCCGPFQEHDFEVLPKV